MKRKPIFYILLIVIILLAVATVGMLVYEIAFEGKTDSIPRATVILLTFALAIGKMLSGGQGSKQSRAAYESAYASIIGGTFTDKARAKRLYTALDKRNHDRYKSAISILTKLYESAPDRDEKFVTAFFIAICYDDMSAYIPAIEWYERAIEYKRHTTALSNLGICYKRMGNLDKATLAYEEASLLDPSNPNPYINLANIYISDGRYDTALEFADKAISLNQGIAAAYSARAIACAMLGDRDGFYAATRSYALNGGDGKGLEQLARSMMAPIFY